MITDTPQRNCRRTCIGELSHLPPVTTTDNRDAWAEAHRREDRRRNVEAKVFFGLAIALVLAVVIFA